LKKDVELCFRDPCSTVFCTSVLIFYGIHFFSEEETAADIGICSQAFLPFIGAMQLIHEHAERRKTQLTREGIPPPEGHFFIGERMSPVHINTRSPSS